MPSYFTIASGQGVSSGGFVERSERDWILEIPSMSAQIGGVRLEWSSQGATGPFGSLVQPNPLVGAATRDQQTYIWSGAGPGWSLVYGSPPTPYVRVAVQNSTTDIATFTVHVLNQL